MVTPRRNRCGRRASAHGRRRGGRGTGGIRGALRRSPPSMAPRSRFRVRENDTPLKDFRTWFAGPVVTSHRDRATAAIGLRSRLVIPRPPDRTRVCPQSAGEHLVSICGVSSPSHPSEQAAKPSLPPHDHPRPGRRPQRPHFRAPHGTRPRPCKSAIVEADRTNPTQGRNVPWT